MTPRSAAAVFSGAGTACISRRRMLAGAGVLAIAAGCARADWVGSTLVTIDVSGDWRGSYATGPLRGSIAMKLEQWGAKVTGTYELSAPSIASGTVGGSISGDTLRFEGATLLNGQLTVGIDEMAGFLTRATATGLTGTSNPGSRLAVLLLRQ